MRSRYSLAVVLFVFTSILTFGQDKTPKQVLDVDRDKAGSGQVDDQSARQAWFRDGRQSPVVGVSSAEMLHRAQQQRPALRVLRQSQTTANIAATSGAAQAVTPATATWQLLAP